MVQLHCPGSSSFRRLESIYRRKRAAATTYPFRGQGPLASAWPRHGVDNFPVVNPGPSSDGHAIMLSCSVNYTVEEARKHKVALFLIAVILAVLGVDASSLCRHRDARPRLSQLLPLQRCIGLDARRRTGSRDPFPVPDTGGLRIHPHQDAAPVRRRKRSIARPADGASDQPLTAAVGPLP